MSQQSTSTMGLRVRLEEPFDVAVARVTAALKAEGFGVLTTIDVQQTLKQKLGAEFRPYTILGACNPPLAFQALNIDLEAGLLLPCNVIVYSQDEATVVSIVDPATMLQVADNPALEPVAAAARSRLHRVYTALTQG